MLLILNLVHMTSSCAALFKTIVCLKSEKQSYYLIFERFIQLGKHVKIAINISITGAFG